MSGTVIVLLTVWLVGAFCFAEDANRPDLLWPLFAMAYIVKNLHPKIDTTPRVGETKVRPVSDHGEGSSGFELEDDDRHQKQIEEWEQRFEAAVQEEDEEVVFDSKGVERPSPEEVPIPEVEVRSD